MLRRSLLSILSSSSKPSSSLETSSSSSKALLAKLLGVGVISTLTFGVAFEVTMAVRSALTFAVALRLFLEKASSGAISPSASALAWEETFCNCWFAEMVKLSRAKILAF